MPPIAATNFWSALATGTQSFVLVRSGHDACPLRLAAPRCTLAHAATRGAAGVLGRSCDGGHDKLY